MYPIAQYPRIISLLPPFCWLHPQRTPPCSQPRVGAAAEPRRHRSGLPLGPSGRKVCTQAGLEMVRNHHNIWVNHLDNLDIPSGYD